jgi:hypothetical protein
MSTRCILMSIRKEFGALLDKPVIRAPQSWQYINI